MQRKNLFFLYWFFLILFMFFPGGVATVAFAKTGIHTFINSSALAKGQWVRIAIPATGIYQITDAELRKMGFSDPSKVGVYGFGGNVLDEKFAVPHIDDLPEVAVYRDETKGRLLFYGQGVVKWSPKSNLTEFTHRNNPYATKAYYFLHQKNESPRKLESIATRSEGILSDTYIDYQLHESDEVNVGNTGREMYGESFAYTRTQDFQFSIPGALSPAKITVDFIANNDKVGSLSGQINGVSFMNLSVDAFKGNGSYVVANKVTGEYDWKPEGNELFKVRLTFNPKGGNTKVAMLNYLRLNVTRKLQLYGAYTLFRSASNAYCIGPKSSSKNLLVWDITDPVNPNLQQTAEFENKVGFVSAMPGLREYALIDPGAIFPTVEFVEQVENQDLHALPQTDMVIIVPPRLRAQADRLADFRRRTDNLSVTVVTPQQIYNEFSSGTPDATAYRLFMKMFYDRSSTLGTPPLYLLLMGDGANDNRGMDSYRWKPSVLENCLLTYQSDPSLNETKSYVCDDYFGFLDDNEGGELDIYGQLTLQNDKVDIGIGRLPVRNLEQAKITVDKIIAYSENRVIGSWKNNLCFLGDDGDGHMHMAHADTMVNIIERQGHHEFIFNKIYLDAYKQEKTASGTAYPAAQKKFFDQLKQGALLVNYSGHGSTNSITHEKLFMLADAENIQMKRLPIWVTATCDFSRFDDFNTSVGEALLLNPNGGAIALFTTTRVVYADVNLQLNRWLIENLFIKHPDGTRYRMGDVIKLAKRKISLASSVNRESKLNFLLLGDPSMKVGYPEYLMEITEIDGAPVGETPILLKALSQVTMKGRVKELGSDKTATHFNGLLYPTVFDSEEDISTIDNLQIGYPYVFKSRTRKLFAGRDSVRNGEFEFSFMVPKDISYSMQSGIVNLYAHQGNEKEAQGYFDKLLVGGTADEISNDTLGPVITELYLNSDSFKEGDVVNATPFLFAQIEDETAINTSGAAIGHDIVATLVSKNTTTRYILNDYFLNLGGEQGKGTVRFSIPTLADGSYQLELKAWDIHNNSTIRVIAFEVNSGAKPAIFDLRTDRNPAREEVNFLLTHNRPESLLKVRIQVYTQMGQCVWDEEVKGSSEYLESLPVNWDLRTSTGERILPGIYIYRASLASDGKHYTTKSRKLIVLKP